jgi:AhpD family alkylhydroperoxidase
MGTHMTDTEKAAKTQAILEKVKGDRGFVRLWPRLLAERDPACLEHIHALTMHALHERNSLPRKTKELILICLNAFDYYEYGFRVHVKSALKCGATEEEILEALEVVGVQKVHALTSMLPILVEEVANFKDGTGDGIDAGEAK